MQTSVLSGAEKTRLRGLGQTLAPAVTVGKNGLTPAILAQLERQLTQHPLIKIRLLGSDRTARASLLDELPNHLPCTVVGAIGGTALLYRPAAEPAIIPASPAEVAAAFGVGARA